MEDNKNKTSFGIKCKKAILIIATIVIFLISNIVFFYLGSIVTISGLNIPGLSKAASKDFADAKDTQKYDLLFQVRNALLTKYDGEIDDTKLLESAIKGMTQSLNDPYTVFMNSNEFKQFTEQSEGHFIGIGVQLGVKDNKVTIVAPIEGSPAEKAGLKAGDEILKVEGNDIESSVDKAISMIKGEEKKPIKLTIKREQEEMDITVMRDEVKLISVKGEIVGDNVGYVKLNAFDENVGDTLKTKIKELKNNGMKGMILDLRGNPGGYLNEAVNVASQFIPKEKVITYTIDKYSNKDQSKSVGGEAQGMPLVVLIDGGSASASEVVTGALRDYKVATIVGTTSFGKGVVQQLIGFKGQQGGLKVTTSKYYTPNGENIHKIGIKPDIQVEIPKELLEKPYDRTKDPQFNKALEVIKGKID